MDKTKRNSGYFHFVHCILENYPLCGLVILFTLKKQKEREVVE